MAEHLAEADPLDHVEWKCKDVFTGNADDIDWKKYLKNKHEQNEAVEYFGYDYPTDHAESNIKFDGYTKGNGKCRLPDGSFGSGDSYYPSGPNDIRKYDD